jgi:hypothetical protein
VILPGEEGFKAPPNDVTRPPAGTEKR